jgi:predicted membrane protein
LTEIDITAETSPTIDLVNQLNAVVIKPVWSSAWALGEDRFPFIIKIIKRLYRKKLSKLEDKHFTGQRNAEMFRKYKKYIFYVFKTS